MNTITQRELRNSSAAVMDRVEGGQSLLITRNGVAVATLAPIVGQRHFVPFGELAGAFTHTPHLNYEQMRAEADELFGDDGDRV